MLVVIGFVFYNGRGHHRHRRASVASVKRTFVQSRLLSIGIASAGIALAVNRLSYALFIDKGGVWIIFGVLMLIVGHAVNTALGILDSGLQSLRLHYVEFFTKFYRGGGTKYRPFGYERKYTEEQ